MHPMVLAPAPVPSSEASCYNVPEKCPRPIRLESVKTERNWNDEFLLWNDQENVSGSVPESTMTRFRNQYKTYAGSLTS